MKARHSPDELACALGLFPPTDEQAAVIAAPPGPLVVIAGAGAGKTETMAARVVWLVANGFARGAAGVTIPLDVVQDGEHKHFDVKSMNRLDHLRLKSTY